MTYFLILSNRKQSVLAYKNTKKIFLNKLKKNGKVLIPNNTNIILL